MKIEKINENKIKVTISIKDLQERNIDLDSLNYNSPIAQELFWDMMEQAEIELGFNASDAQLVIEASSDSEDGFVVTISKVDEEGDFESIEKYIKSKYKKSDLRGKRKNRKICSSILIYSFNDFEDLNALVKKLPVIYNGDSTLYKCRETYYLILTKNNTIVSKLKVFENILGEYGDKVLSTGFFEGYLCEYGEKIIEYDAIQVLNSYF
jgi:adapter protein MecA 1/2